LHSPPVDPEIKRCGWHPPTAELTHQKLKGHGDWRRPQRSWTSWCN
jgi:hypothetical protein